MEENKKIKNSDEGCECLMCQGKRFCAGHEMEFGQRFHARHIILRWVLGLMILAIVFWMGFSLGEFKGKFEGNRGFYSGSPYMMNTNTPYYGYGMPMMNGWGSNGYYANPGQR